MAAHESTLAGANLVPMSIGDTQEDEASNVEDGSPACTPPILQALVGQVCRFAMCVAVNDPGTFHAMECSTGCYESGGQRAELPVNIEEMCEHLPVSRVVMYSISLLVCFACLYKAYGSATYRIKAP